jgi:hypothetical protein
MIADISAIATKVIHNRRVFRDIAERGTILIHVCIATTNGVALTSKGFTSRSGILMSTATRYQASLQGPVAGPQSWEEVYHNIFPILPLNPSDRVRSIPSSTQ